MNFLFNSSFYKPAYRMGGPIYSVSALAEKLVERGHQVYVTASNRDHDYKLDVDLDKEHIINGVIVKYFDAQPTLLQRTKIPAFAKAGINTFGRKYYHWLESKKEDIDIVDSQISFLGTNKQCAAFAVKYNKLLFYHQRGSLAPIHLRYGKLKKNIFIRLIEKPVMKKSNALIALTEYERLSFLKQGISNNKIFLCPNGIAHEYGNKLVQPDSVQIDKLLQSLGDSTVFFWISRIHFTKGITTFVDAFIKSAPENPKAIAIVAGVDELNLIDIEIKKIRDAGLSNRFFYVGAVQGNDKLSLWQRANCFVLPTISEGFSMAILEALATKCAVLTTEGAHFEEIEKSGAGHIVPNTIADFSKWISIFYNKGNIELEEMGRRGYELVKQHYTWDIVADKYENICMQLLKKR